ncbi:hypothetical protein Tco_1049959 [Tanacetum coccineum]
MLLSTFTTLSDDLKLSMHLSINNKALDVAIRHLLGAARAVEATFIVLAIRVLSGKMVMRLVEAISETPLIHDARQRHTSNAKYFIEHGVIPTLSSELGATDLHHVVGIVLNGILQLASEQRVDS